MAKNFRFFVLCAFLCPFFFSSSLRAEEKSSQASAPSEQLQRITFESTENSATLKLEASAGLSDVIEEKLHNPGRLILDFPRLQNAGNINLSQMNDSNVIPRVRLAVKPDRLRLIIDTVLKEMPAYQISKNEHALTLTINKSPEEIQEALSKAKLFAEIQKGDKESQLKLGSEDEGGLLFEGTRDSAGMYSASKGDLKNIEGTPVSRGSSNRVVFTLKDNKDYKIFLEESQTPVHIERIRPGYEVKGIQARLRHLGYNTGLVDGDVGEQTREALKQFQKDRGLPVTGKPDKKTQRALREEFGY